MVVVRARRSLRLENRPVVHAPNHAVRLSPPLQQTLVVLNRVRVLPQGVLDVGLGDPRPPAVVLDVDRPGAVRQGPRVALHPVVRVPPLGVHVGEQRRLGGQRDVNVLGRAVDHRGVQSYGLLEGPAVGGRAGPVDGGLRRLDPLVHSLGEAVVGVARYGLAADLHARVKVAGEEEAEAADGVHVGVALVGAEDLEGEAEGAVAEAHGELRPGDLQEHGGRVGTLEEAAERLPRRGPVAAVERGGAHGLLLEHEHDVGALPHHGRVAVQLQGDVKRGLWARGRGGEGARGRGGEGARGRGGTEARERGGEGARE